MKTSQASGRNFARVFSSTLIAASVLAVTSGIAAAAGLFDYATQADMRAAAQADAPQPGDFRDRLVRRTATPGAKRERLVRLNADELAKIIPSGFDRAPDRGDRARRLSNSLTLDLFPDTSVTTRRTDIETPESGGYVWAGEGGAPHAYVTLVIKNGDIYGNVQAGAKVFTIEPVTGAVHRIIEIDPSRTPDHIHVEVPPSLLEKESEAAEPAPVADPKRKTVVRVMVVNTIRARNECRPGTVAQKQDCIEARGDLGISRSNQAFNRSGVLVSYVRVGGLVEVNYNEGGYDGINGGQNYVLVLCDLTKPSFGCGSNQHAKFNTVRTKRDQLNADFVVLYRKQGAACGVAWVPDPPTAGTAQLGYSVVTSTKGGVYNCVETDAFAHETGHNAGLLHDREQWQIDNQTTAIPPKTKYNFGHVDDVGDFFTIMAYRSSCNAGAGCRRLPNFSNPNKNDPVSGRPTGKAQGTPGIQGAANNAQRWNDNRAIVGAYQ